MKSTSSCPSRHTSRYSGLDVRTIVVVRPEHAFEIIAATMFDSSREVQAIKRSALAIPAPERTLRLAPFPWTVATSYLVESAVSRDSSRSNTVSSCSSCSAWTIVAPTWPAPITKMFTLRRLLRSPPGDPIAVGYRDPRCGPCSSLRRSARS